MKQNNSSNQEYQFYADKPIQNRKEDKLGRGKFSESLAKAITSWKGTDSLVIGLYGPWGSGKSSIKNMVLEVLNEAAKFSKPDVMEFSPWQFSGQDQLLEAFFNEIGIALGHTDDPNSAKRLAAKWRSYAAAFKIGFSITTVFQWLLPVIFGIIALISFGISAVAVEKIRLFAGIWGAICLAIAGALKWWSGFSKTVSEWLGANAESRVRNVAEIRKDLTNLLKQRRKPLLVIIDDVDRLSPNEIRLLFQLVKANADLPNLIYLLLFQRDLVEKSLEELGPEGFSGRDFLEKIIQAGFDLPVIELGRLEKILFEGLDNALSVESVSTRFSKKRWANLYFGGLKNYFQTLRQVHRYLSSFAFHIGLFRNESSFEVNPVDLIGLEALRLFEPDVYSLLSTSKSFLTERFGDYSASGLKKEDVKARIERIIGKASAEHQKDAEEILKELFPAIEWIIRGYGYGEGFEEGWYRDLRVCSSDVFDRYFHFAVPEGDLSQAEIERILAATKSGKDPLVQELKVLSNRGMLEVALDRLEAYKEKIDLNYAHALVTALFDVGDAISTSGESFFDISPDMHASRIIHWYLKRETNPERKEKILEDALRETVGLYLPVMKISLEIDRKNKNRQSEDYLIQDGKIDLIKNLGVDMIRKAAGDGRLRMNRKLLYILYRWKSWDSEELVRDWVKELIKDDESLLYFLQGLLLRSVSSSSGERWYISPKVIEDFIPLEEIEKRVSEIQEKNLGPDQQKAVNAFNKAIERKRSGKPDEGTTWDVDDEGD